MRVPLSRRFSGVEFNSILTISEVIYPDKCLDGTGFLKVFFFRIGMDHRYFGQFRRHNEAAVSTVPTPRRGALFVITTSTGYFHSINLAQPQYAHFLPRNLPANGIITIVNNNSSCCRLSLHSLSASESSSLDRDK